MEWNLAELNMLQTLHEAWACPFLDKVLAFVTMLGDHGQAFILLALVLLCIPKTRKLGLGVGIALILDLLLVNLGLKPLLPLRAHGGGHGGGGGSHPRGETGVLPHAGLGLCDGLLPALFHGALPHRCAGGSGVRGSVRGGCPVAPPPGRGCPLPPPGREKISVFLSTKYGVFPRFCRISEHF